MARLHRSLTLVASVFVGGCSGSPASGVPSGSGPTDAGTQNPATGGNQGAVIGFAGNSAGGAGGGGTASPVCGNGVIDPAEGCDDGNTVPGDGCNGTCRVEPGYSCPVPGTACEASSVCGDGMPSSTEACDDGDTEAGDGCSATCTVEPGYACLGSGQACLPTTSPPVCGNGLLEYGETCDDGNLAAADGCQASCQLETGWVCPTPGAACERSVYCGDGVLNQSSEQCDDGNLRTGDCCNGSCLLEPNCICTAPVPALVPPHQICSFTVVCGDGKVSGSEICDDANTQDGDGCSHDCNNVETGFTCPAGGGACREAVATCGNAGSDIGEECDDGNTDSGDGCSANCRVESGYVCPAVGQRCRLVEVCGDGLISYTRGENCDDGSTQAGDGCSAICHIEPNWICQGSPSVCRYDVVCGDQRLTGAETCDDGNTRAGDGCGSDCRLEDGYACPIVGAVCQAECGDGKILGREQCDDGDAEDGDGCSRTCQIEPGWVCPAGQACRKTICGDGAKEGSEQCDDTNTSLAEVDRPFDGCYHCIREPDCAAGACVSPCGDGQRFANEACDDGNTFNGDGCSSTCQSEPGYSCTDSSLTTAPPTRIDLPILVRDFVGIGHQVSSPPYHLDFNLHYGNWGGLIRMVKPTLGADGRPVWRWSPMASGANSWDAPLAGCSCDEAAATSTWACANETWTGPTAADARSFAFCRPPCSCTGGAGCVCDNPGHMYVDNGVANSNRRNLSTPANFAQWFTDVPGTNLTLPYTLPLSLDATTGTYANVVSNDFGPLGTGGWVALGNETQANCTVKNVSFTTETHFWFEYTGGEYFEFSGDDDTWVFVKGQLVVDLGGLHQTETGSFQLSAADGTATAISNSTPSTVALGLVLGSVYEVAMFQAERNECGSNFKVSLKNFAKPPSVCLPVCGDGVLTGNEACDLGKDADGNNLNTGAYGGCTSDCQLAPFCGDGVLQAQYSEECDDGSNATPYGSRSGCGRGCVFPPYCGDGRLDTAYGEACDNGTSNSSTAYGAGVCTTNCLPGDFCGDGFKNGPEECDDGGNNGAPTSQCNTSCGIKCGNGVVEAGEQCDLGAALNTGTYDGCRSNCTRAPYCGDGHQDPKEQCDDGKNDGSYGTCKADCTLAPYCGDGTLDSAAGELCDQGANNAPDAYGPDRCTPRCRPAPYCGDHAVNTDHGEVCDDGNHNSNTVPGACKLDCSGYNPPPITCGNGAADAGEECDDGSANGTSVSVCDLRCQLKCGNGSKDPGEACDDGINDGSYGTCQPDCTLGPYCGDAALNGPEQCDQGASNQATAYGRGLCTTQCLIAPYCGDGRTQSPPEQCDGQPGCDSSCQLSGPE